MGKVLHHTLFIAFLLGSLYTRLVLKTCFFFFFFEQNCNLPELGLDAYFVTDCCVRF